MFSFDEVEPVPMRIAASRQIGSHVQQVELSFDPGAHVAFPVGSNIRPLTWGCIPRCYSVAEAGASSVTITVSFTGMGAGARFFATSPVGTPVDVFGPFDDYGYHPGTGRPKVFVAAGTGIAPFVRMIPQAVAEGVSVLLVLGVRAEQDILYRSYFEKIAAASKNFGYIFTLSRGAPGWHGARGYVTAQLNRGSVPLLSASDVYVCGIPDMVADVVTLARRLGTPAPQVFAEKYG